MSFKALRSNRVRSLLTMLGVIIGITAVVVIMSVGAGAQSLILSQIEKSGSNLIGIMPGAAKKDGPPASAMGINVKTLTYEDSVALQNQIPEIIATAAYTQSKQSVVWENYQEDLTIVGTTASYIKVENSTVSFGEFFTPAEERSLARVAVLGSKTAKNIFNNSDPIGQKIKIKRETFTIIGVLKERGTVAFQNPDEQIFIPISSAQKLLLGINNVNLIRAKIEDSAGVPAAMDQAAQILRDRHNIRAIGEEDFDIRNQADAISQLTTITSALKFFLAAIAAISLLVGGIGIMNVMYVSVNERTQEIGLRMAMGAKRKDLLKQFLFEAIMVTFIGGAIGIVLGIGLSFLVAVVAQYLSYAWKFSISPLAIFAGLSFTVAIGLIFGYFPAKKAANLNPIEALRYE